MFRVFRDSQLSVPKGNNEIKILLVKACSLTQKTNQILSATIKKIKFRQGNNLMSFQTKLLAEISNHEFK